MKKITKGDGTKSVKMLMPIPLITFKAEHRSRSIANVISEWPGLGLRIQKDYDGLKDVVLQYCVLTPEIATSLRTFQHTNRSKSNDQVKRKTSIIIQETFTPYPIGIRLANDGRMYDGNQTCCAVEKAGKPIITGVLSHIPLEVGVDDGVCRAQSLTDRIVRLLDLSNVPPKIQGIMAKTVLLLSAPRTNHKIIMPDMDNMRTAILNNYDLLYRIAEEFPGKTIKGKMLYCDAVRGAFAKAYHHMSTNEWTATVMHYKLEQQSPSSEIAHAIFRQHNAAVQGLEGNTNDASKRFYHYGTLAVFEAFLDKAVLQPWHYNEALANRLDDRFLWPAAKKCGIIKY